MSIPHAAQITVNAIVYKQEKDGKFSPQAVHHDAFAMEFQGESADDVINKLKDIIQGMKDAKESRLHADS